MDYEVDGNGFLVNQEDWSEDVAKDMAAKDDLELTEKHWDVINYLREQFFEESNQPNMRHMMKDMDKIWGSKDAKKVLYELYPQGPAKQACKYAGLPETKTKGGY